MRAVIILDSPSDKFEPLAPKNKSISLLPTNLKSNLLSMMFSSVNSYFSKDKIYVVCQKEEYSEVKDSLEGVSEENILVEPKRLSFSISLIFANRIIGKLFPKSTVFYFRANFIFPVEFKMSKWIISVSEMTNKGWIVEPSILLDKGVIEKRCFDAGRIVSINKGVEYYEVNEILDENQTKKRKKFGKQSKTIGILCGKTDLFEQYLSASYKSNVLSTMFKDENANWEEIVEAYKKLEIAADYSEIGLSVKNILTIFLDIKPYYLDNWNAYFERFSVDNRKNVIFGNVKESLCKRTICYNYDREEMTLDSVENLVIVKKDGKAAIKYIYQ